MTDPSRADLERARRQVRDDPERDERTCRTASSTRIAHQARWVDLLI